MNWKRIIKEIKVVFNACHGGFSLSSKAFDRLKELGVEGLDECENEFGFIDGVLTRHDPRLVQVIEELGEKANGRCAYLKIACIYGSKYRIDDFAGRETVVEPEDVEKEWIIVS